jgi:hypothetical protein
MDPGKIRSLDSALREALVSTRPSPALPSAETASDHELGHPGRNGVIVNLSGGRDAGVDTRRPAEGARAPLETAAREISARGADVLARALHAAHTGVTATVAQALARAGDHATSDFDVPRTTPADTVANASGAPRAQASPAGPIAPGVVPPDAGARAADPHVAAMLMMAGPGATVGSVYSEHVRQATAPAPHPVPRPAAELVAPFLVRQEQAEPPAPYINYLIAGAGLLGLVLLLAL